MFERYALDHYIVISFTLQNIDEIFSATLLQVAHELVVSFEEEINNYLTLVVNQTENELGRCGPLANVYKSVVEASCSRIVNPLVCLFFIISFSSAMQYNNIWQFFFLFHFRSF